MRVPLRFGFSYNDFLTKKDEEESLRPGFSYEYFVSEEKEELLRKLGFDLSEIDETKDVVFIDLPDNLQCVEEYLDFDRRVFTIYLNNIPIISITQKMDVRDGQFYDQVNCYISATNINQALQQQKEKQDSSESDQQPSLWKTPFQDVAINTLNLLELSIESSNGVLACHIARSLNVLQTYMEENPEECNKIIASVVKYQQLYALFPKWHDEYGVKQYCEGSKTGGYGLSLLKIMEHFKDKIQQEPQLLTRNKNTDPVVTALKRLCYDYAHEIFNGPEKNLANEKIKALKILRQALDKENSIQNGKANIETVLKKVEDILKKDGDSRAMRFLKEFGRILQAVFTGTYESRQKASMQESGTSKFWKPASELHAKKFIKQVREHASIEEPVVMPPCFH